MKGKKMKNNPIINMKQIKKDWKRKKMTKSK